MATLRVLLGSSFVTGTASKERGGPGLTDRIRMAPYARYAIQVGIRPAPCRAATCFPASGPHWR